MRITFIGGGNMASALITGLQRAPSEPVAGQHRIQVIETDAAQRDRLTQRFNVRAIAQLDDAAAAVDVIVLATKPQQLFEVVAPLAARLGHAIDNPLLLSIAAGIRTEDIARWAGNYRRVIRAMPNTPALIGSGITGLAALPEARAADRAAAETIMRSVGEVIWVADDQAIDAVTAVSGSGPAYVFFLIEAIEAAAARIGLDSAAAHRLTIATALAHLQDHQVSARITEAVEAAYRRAQTLAAEFGQR
jgi:pyrroline-5-carboxylate reductase